MHLIVCDEIFSGVIMKANKVIPENLVAVR